ncbi:MAG: thiamine biosynthesis protein ApbE [Bacteroidetes bacterium]|nr:MAG: thiamine biosynthesis protein ApbE [Bacteroidota bacterium]PTM11020.1 MAG: thiamine biosynthesis protein ApbE [Bacteroidota bacterium]
MPGLRPLVLCLLALGPGARVYAQQPATASQVLRLMGCRFELTAVATTDTIAWQAIRAGVAEIQRIERLISSWDENSQTSAINRNAGVQPMRVDRELYDLIYRAKKVSQLTHGAFDISFASMDKIWHFDGTMLSLPTPEAVAEARQYINWQDIELNPTAQTVFLRRAGMKIGFGAIGKGYAANRAKALLQALPGVQGGLVNASGDLISWGTPPTDAGWVIKIADPKNKHQVLGWLQIGDMAVVTSGDYERYLEFDGVRYAHIIDPRTGYPTTGIKSVTVVCPDAELADALATSVFVLGKTAGLELVNQLKGVACLIVTDDDELFSSTDLQLNYYSSSTNN